MEKEKRDEVFNLIQKEHEKESQNSPPKSEAAGIVRKLHDTAVVEQVKTSAEYQKKFFVAAAKSIDNELEILHLETLKRRQETAYNANEDACQNYGIRSDVPLWQVNLMKIGSGFWFVIYWIFASLTIAPLNIFFKGINTFIKNVYVVFIFSIVGYLIIVVGIPLLIAFTNKG